MRSPPPLPDGASSACAGAGSGASSRLPLPEVSAPPRASSSAAGSSSGRCLVGSSAGASSSPARSDPSPSRAIVSPTGSVSPSFATIVERAVGVGLVGHVGLVRLDLDELFPALDLVPVGLQPLEDRALLHRVGQAGHRDIGHARQSTPFARLNSASARERGRRSAGRATSAARRRPRGAA